MKIGIDISQIAYEWTGTAKYFENLISWLPKVAQQNEYRLFASSLRRQDKLRPFAKIVWPFPPTVLDFLWNQLHVFPVENFIGEVDVFHSSDWIQPPTKAKKVCPILDMVVYKYPQSVHPQIVAVQKRRMKLVKKEADLVITISESSKKDIVEILKIPPEKVRVVYLAPGLEFKPQNEVAKDYVLTMGSISNLRKNVANVIAACEKANIPVKIIDGSVTQDELPKLYARAKCFVYASSYEGFGIPILEAMACGIPVICGKNSSMPEVAGEAATYANVESVDDLADKIAHVNPTGKELSQAKKFSWEKTARETLKVYEELA